MDELANQHSFNQKAPREGHWLDGGDRYTVLEPSATNPKWSDLAVYESASGKRSVLVAAPMFQPPGAANALEVEQYDWSADKRHLLLFTNSKKVWRDNTRGDFWVLDLATAALTKLGGAARASSLMFAKFSPDSRSAGYVREHNVYVEELATHTIHQLTTDGSADILNGTTDWVTEEEFSLRDAFRWSPDSKSIAYWQFDQSGVGDYTLIDDTRELYPVTSQYRYPQAGTTNAAVRLGVVPATGGETRWIKLPGNPRDNYIVRADWVGDAGELAVEQLNRLQNDDRIFLVRASSDKVSLLSEDRDETFVDAGRAVETMPHILWALDSTNRSSRDGRDQAMVLLSERDGWRHAYLVSRDTGQPRLITHFSADVIAPVSLDPAHGFFYFTASPTDPVRIYLYRARLDGTGAPERVTPLSDAGVNKYDISPDGKWAIHDFSHNAQPSRFDLVSLPDHRVVRTLEANGELEARVRKIGVAPKEFSETTISGGIRVSTSLIKPPNFDPTKKYPVLTYVYGESASLTVLDSYGILDDFHSFIAREGYLILSFDTPGTPAPRGRAWRRSGYGAIGVLSSAQQVEAIQAFAQAHPFVDTSRMAIWGASGGGTSTLNMMFRHPGVYSTGMAFSGVPDQAHYDTIYQERYMGTPQSNPTGYHEAAAINYASGLDGNLLIVHGSADDNVHFQLSELLVNRLIELGKPFDFMDYPNRSHGLAEGPGTRAHWFTLIARYLEDHVPCGPRPR